MLELQVHDRQGNVLETIQFDESCLGKFINRRLLHQAVVMYEANRRQGNASTKPKRALSTSTRKPHAQKGTGRARQGHRRRVGSRGGATCHGPVPRDFSAAMPKKARRQATNSALLGKFRGGEVTIVSELHQDEPKTKDMAETLKNLKLGRSCLVVTDRHDPNLWKSVRNLPDTDLTLLRELNAYTILRRKHLLMTRAALAAIQPKAK